MKLKKLWIDGFKNLNDFEFDFTDKDGVTVLIGNNGSGKSNVLEAISIIFIELQNKYYRYQFDYEIDYEINNENIKIKQDSESEKVSFYINGDEISTLEKDKLPYKVIASYNGAVERLWEIYKDSYFNFNRQKITTERNSILYIDLDELDVYKLMSVYNEIYDVYIEDDITKKESLKSRYTDLNITVEINSYDKGLVKNENLMIFLNAISVENIIIFDSLVDYFNSNLPNTKQDFLNYLFNCKFRTLVKEFKNEEQNLLSEGEQHLKLLELLLEVLAEQDTLILLDEPDSHIHVGNKKKITNLLKKLDDIGNEIILTTHSPLLTHTFDDKHIAMITNGKIEDKTKQEVFSHITEGIWSYQEQSIFLSSQKDIVLLVEGKHDKIHIKEAFSRLKDEYDDLDFDVFSVDGADNIHQLLIGIKSSFNMFDKTKKYIGLFDCDAKGRDIVGKSAERTKYASLGKSKNFYHMYLPFDKYEKDFEIENMYPEAKLQEAYKKAINITTTNINKNTIEKEAKKQLSIMCKDFNDNNEDFKKFQELFNIINNIKGLQ